MFRYFVTVIVCCKRFLKQNNGRVSRKWSHGRVMKCFIKKHLFLIKCRSGAGSVMVCLKTCCSENSSFCGWVVTRFSEFSLQSQRMFSSWWLQPHPLFSHHRGHISLNYCSLIHLRRHPAVSVKGSFWKCRDQVEDG